MATQGQQGSQCSHMEKRLGIQIMAGILLSATALAFSLTGYWYSVVRHKCRQASDYLLQTCHHLVMTKAVPLLPSFKSSCTGSPPSARHGAARPHSDQLQKKPLRFLQVLLPAGVEGSKSGAVQHTVIRSPADSHHRSPHYVTVCSTRNVHKQCLNRSSTVAMVHLLSLQMRLWLHAEQELCQFYLLHTGTIKS